MRAVAVAHPNVALVKYWGKRAAAGNLPATGSLSLVLGGLATETTVQFDPGQLHDRVLLDGREDAETTARVTACLDLLRREAGVSAGAVVLSRNDFPTGAGLASSASGFAALVTAGAGALGLDLPPQRLAEIARQGSGSAPRSLLGGIVLLRNRDASTVCEQIAAPADWPLQIVVAVTTAEPKAISSRARHGPERTDFALLRRLGPDPCPRPRCGPGGRARQGFFRAGRDRRAQLPEDARGDDDDPATTPVLDARDAGLFAPDPGPAP